jgi:nucleoid-associated protein YgaU
LTAAHERCERFVGHVARSGRALTRADAGTGDQLVSTRLVITPEPAWRGIAGRARRVRRGPVVAAALAVGALAVGGTAIVSAVIDGRLDLGGMPAASSSIGRLTPSQALVTAAPSTSAAPTDIAPSVTPFVPSPVPPEVPSPSPTTLPSPAPPEPSVVLETYVVDEGDTLALIADRFGTSVEALLAANDIDDPNEILIGDVLVLP